MNKKVVHSREELMVMVKMGEVFSKALFKYLPTHLLLPVL